MSRQAILLAQNRRAEGDTMSDGEVVTKEDAHAAEFGRQINDLLIPIFDAEHAGALTATVGVQPIRLPFEVEVIDVTLAVGTAPVGAAILVDVNDDGTTIYTTQASRPTIADGATSGEQVAAADAPVIAADSLIRVDVDQIGSGTAGSNLGVVLRVRPTINVATSE